MRSSSPRSRSMFRAAVISALAWVAAAAGARAQSTAFTYQGQLKSGGALAEGQHDFRFRLFDAASGGTQVGTTQCADNIQVKDGVFTATVDFGNQFATPTQRFIEILVRRDTGLGCADTSGYATLSPRQPITPAPTATQAASAFSLGAPDGSPSKAVYVDNDGKIGIGTVSPSSQLELFGVPDALRITANQPVITFRDTSNASTRTILQGVNGGMFTIGERFLNGTDGTAFTLMDAFGNLAIGHYSPQAKLDVNGSAIVRGIVQMGPTGAYRAAGGEENLRIVRGTISAGGGIVRGSGFQCSRTSAGRYSVIFNTAFIGAPSVTATIDRAGGASTWISTSVTASDFAVYCVDPSFNGVDEGFHFVAVGPR